MTDGYTHDPEAFDGDDEYVDPAADGEEDAEHPETAYSSSSSNASGSWV